jgi:threonine dehydrogenase-like Zn-dependent dehydrogenase
MKALLLDDEGLSLRRDLPRPRRGPGEALVRLTKAGICSTDLEIVKGYAGFRGIPGHEFVGVVEEADESHWIGRRVVGTINLACRRCVTCLGSGPEHCPSRTVLGIIGRDGAFAEHLTLPEANLLEVPDALADEDLTKLVVGEVNAVGSRCGPFAPALRLLAAKAVAVGPLVEGEYALEDGLAAFEHAARPGVRKILLRP